MKPMHWVVILSAIGAIALATLLFGWPKDLGEADGFAGMISAILTPVSLILLVMTLEKQQDSQRQATRDGFLSVQVQALIALIEDDRAMLDGMSARYRATGIKVQAFLPVQQRYRKRVAKLNAILGSDLRLPDMTEEGAG